VFVDIASPPTGTLSHFNLYVALSRSCGRGTIRLLRDFDDQIFVKKHDGAVLEEDLDELLAKYDEQTHECQWYERVLKG
jgi:hypothetical protein